jgi:hypothetical protein
MFVGMVFLGGLHHTAAANCEAIVGCHIGQDVATLKTWLGNNVRGGPACVHNLNCNIGNCSLCTDPRVVTLTRAFWAIEEGACDPELVALIRVQREACMASTCCPSCPAAQFTQAYRQCSVPFSDAETLFSSAYLAIAVLIFTARATTTTSVSLYNVLFKDQSQSGSNSYIPAFTSNPDNDPSDTTAADTTITTGLML